MSNEGNQDWSGYHLGLTLGKRAFKYEDYNYELDLRYEDQEGLVDKSVRFTINKKFENLSNL